MLFQRESGLLLHPTSLPGPYGIGEIGASALHWLDELRAMEQRIWQVLPLGPTGFGDSPYQSFSSFAAAPLLLSLDSLVERGLLERSATMSASFAEGNIDFGSVIAARLPLLRRAAREFVRGAQGADGAAFEKFRRRQSGWLGDWALFDALKQVHEARPWTEWPADLRARDPAAVARAREELAEPIAEAEALQFLVDAQWSAVRGHARALGVTIVGDIPIFVAHDSADVWQHRELFEVDANGQPESVAGVPPDYFSRTGQRWGNPLFRWSAHAAEDYSWWRARVRRALELVDVVRIDHFRGFAAYWEIPASEPTAIKGRWVPGPGADLFELLRRDLGVLPIIAEDLGLITPDVAALRDDLALPGMRVFQFAFGGDVDNPHLPDHYVENCVAYSGTHDNDTLAGWLAGETTASTRTTVAVRRERARFLRYIRRKKRRLPADLRWACLEILLSSRAGGVVLPLQDVLGVGSEARMNTPGRADGNWRWRFRGEELTPSIKSKLARRTLAAGRNARVIG